jgi:glucose/mannose-6-phosphate isomerase
MIELIKKLDPTGQFDVLKNSYLQIEDALKNEYSIDPVDSGIKNIVISGLGGSAIAGDVFALWAKDELKVPLFVNRNYGVPSFTSKDTLVILSSYSGETEETLSAYKAAGEIGARRICITTGGTLKSLAEKDGVPAINMMPGFQPRYALYTSFFTLLNLFSRLGLVQRDDQLLNRIVERIKLKGEQLSEPGNIAYEIATQVNGKLPVIYSATGVTDSIGTRFKGQFNENGKTHAFHNSFPEMNHNEIIGWETYGAMKESFYVFQVLDETIHPQIKKRFEVFNEILAKLNVPVVKIQSSMETYRERLFDMIYYVDWITYYRAIVWGKDPVEIDYIHLLKSRLKD